MLVILAAAASIATSPRRPSARWRVEAPDAAGVPAALRPEAAKEQTVLVRVNREAIDHDDVRLGSVQLTGSVRWADAAADPADTRTATLAVELLPIGQSHSWPERAEVEVGHRSAQPFDLQHQLNFDGCVPSVGCVLEYRVRFERLDRRGGELEVEWSVRGHVGSSVPREEIETPRGAAISIEVAPPKAGRIPSQRSSDEATAFPGATTSPGSPPPPVSPPPP